MDFIKYNSIENSYNTKFLSKIAEYGYNNLLWVVTNKIHGANFAFHCDGKEVRCASKSQMLDENSRFYSFQRVLDKYRDRVLKVWDFMNFAYGSETITLFGEIFGGSYDHPDVPRVPNTSKVQKGVFYTPDNDFYLFDVYSDGRVMSQSVLPNIVSTMGCPWAKPLFTGTLEECLAYPNDFEDPTHKFYGLPAIENNITEGVVIKPIAALFFGDSRVFVKNKNEKWTEKSREKKRVKDSNLTPEALEQVEIIGQYVTDQRVANVLSHIGQVEDKDFGKFIGEFTRDVLSDYFKENQDAYDILEESDQKSVRASCSRICSNFLRPKFKEIVYK